MLQVWGPQTESLGSRKAGRGVGVTLGLPGSRFGAVTEVGLKG